MQKIGRIGTWFFLILIFLFQLTSQAQSKKYFVIAGTIVPESGETGSGVIEVTKNGKDKSIVQIPKNHRFRLELEFFNEFILTFKYPGHFDKTIIVSTDIPQEVWSKDNDFPPYTMAVQLLKEFEGIDKSFTQKPTGKIFYRKDIDNFSNENYIPDIQYVDQIETAKTKATQVQKEAQSISKEESQELAAKQKNFDQLIKEADTKYQHGEFQLALTKYMEAQKLFPEKAYPNDRVAELQDLVKALQLTDRQKSELERKYKDVIAKANGFFEQKSYQDALPLYKEALQYKPGDEYTNGRIKEIDQVQALLAKQKQYEDLIAKADGDYKSKNYDQAIGLYNQAKQVLPDEQYPQNQINQINQEIQQQANLDQLEKEFNLVMQAADKLFQKKDYPNALNSYKKALGLKPDSKLAQDKIAETELAIANAETDKKYQQAIQQADQALAANDLTNAKLQYQEALKLKSGEAYPKTKLDEISAIEAKEVRFNELVAKAEKAFTDNSLDESLNLFTQALEIKPKNAAVQKRIDEIQNLKNQKLSDKEYTNLIAQADQSYQESQMDASLSAYNKALLIKKNETYPKDQVKKIGTYQTLVKKGDKLFDTKDYDGSMGAFNEVLTLKPKDVYATGKLAEIEKIRNENKKLEDQAKAELAAYNEAIKNADQFFTAQSYSESLGKYKEAASIKPSETYPPKRIKEVEGILSKLEKEKAQKDKDYQAMIAQADNDFGNKEYTNAKDKYQKALVLKSEEAYPKDQIRKIDETLAENLRRESENQRLQKEKQDLAFNQAMAAADKSFAGNDFVNAKAGYQTALTIKPNDPTAKDKLAQTEAKLAQLALMAESYKKAINEADKLFTGKRYNEAKTKYQEALQYQSDADYPKQQIAKIDALLSQQEALAKTRQDFDQALAEGETLLKNKELTKAKDAFTKANNLIPAEPLPPKRIGEINALLEAQARKDSELKAQLEAYQKAIQRADQFFGSKDYNSAQLGYKEALAIKPEEKYPANQLALIEKLLNELNGQNYNNAITKADNAFAANKFADATSGYQEALTIKKGDPYATRQLKEIEKRKAEIEAENIRLKKLQEQFDAMIADANKDFGNKEYPDAKDKYQKALVLKPEEIYPKDKIAKIDQLINNQQKEEETNRQYAQAVKAAQDAFKANKLKEARDSYQVAANLKPSEPMPPVKIAEIDKMLGQLDETARLKAQEEAQRLAKEKADRERYEKAIADGDKAFAEKEYMGARTHYSDALSVLQNEKYPKDQIARIDKLISQSEKDKMLAAQKAHQDSLQKAKDQLFNLTMAAAKEHDQNKRYAEAIQKYKDAIQIKPDQKTEIQKLIKDIENKMQLLAKQEADYNRIIKLADDYYAATKLKEALTEYTNALAIKAGEEYPQKQIKAIQDLLAALDENYSKAITAADKAFDAADWKNAKTGYTEALNLKPKEVYPANRLKEVNQKISEANLAAISNAAENKAYKDAIEKAEKSFQSDQLSLARTQFQAAQKLKPDETLPAERIKEIDALLDQRNKDQLAKAQRELDEKYRQAITVADNSFREKSYPAAKLQYKQALTIKPDESYPKDQITLIDKLLNEAKPVEPVEPVASKLPEVVKSFDKPATIPTETAQTTEKRAQSFHESTDFDEVIKKADASFGINDYTVARFYYTKANELKPAEEYPKSQLEIIRKLIDSQLSGKDLTEYDQAIAQADKAFSDVNYPKAKFYYYKALEIKSWEKYPKDRINEIQALTHSLLSEKEEKIYHDVISKADEAYFSKDIAIARFYYNKALTMKKDEKYPSIKLLDIQKLLDQDEHDQGIIEYRKRIELADQAFQRKDFSIARFNYNKALLQKPDDKYAKDQLKAIKEALDKKSE